MPANDRIEQYEYLVRAYADSKDEVVRVLYRYPGDTTEDAQAGLHQACRRVAPSLEVLRRGDGLELVRLVNASPTIDP